MMFAQLFVPFRQLVMIVLFSMLFPVFFGLASVLYAQETESEKPAKKKAPKAGQTAELEGDHFVTSDGVRMSATYYYGNANKDTAPVLLLHGDGGSRRDFTPLIDLLVDNGYAVLAADLRGHGKSIKRYEIMPPKIEIQAIPIQRNNSGGGRGQKPKIVAQPIMTAPASTKQVDYLAAEFQSDDYAEMYKADLPLLRHTLEKVHVEGMVNLHRLVIVGVGRGAALAAYWAAMDWRERNSDQFTKTLVLIAPTEQDMANAFSNNKRMRDKLGILFAIPDGETVSLGIAERIRTVLLEKLEKNEKNDEEKIAENFPIYDYTSMKTTKSDKGETKTEMTIAETFSSGEARLGGTVFNFIDQRNKELEIRWSKLK